MKLQLLVQVNISIYLTYCTYTRTHTHTHPSLYPGAMCLLYGNISLQEVNNVIEETSQEVVSNLPRVLRDIDGIKHEAAMLQEQMKNIKQDVQKVSLTYSVGVLSII